MPKPKTKLPIETQLQPTQIPLYLIHNNNLGPQLKTKHHLLPHQLPVPHRHQTPTL